MLSYYNPLKENHLPYISTPYSTCQSLRLGKRVLESLQFANNLPELKGYFDKEPFIKIKFHEESKEAIMMDSGYTHNLSTKFWRVLKTIELIKANRTNIQMSNYLLEVFTNQCLSFTDILATWVNHFLKLGLSGTKLSTHNEKFVKCLQDQITDDKIKSLVEDFFSWSKIKLYPYRNIIHHMGELSGGVSMDLSFVAVPKKMGTGNCTPLNPKVNSLSHMGINGICLTLQTPVPASQALWTLAIAEIRHFHSRKWHQKKLGTGKLGTGDAEIGEKLGTGNRKPFNPKAHSLSHMGINGICLAGQVPVSATQARWTIAMAEMWHFHSRKCHQKIGDR